MTILNTLETATSPAVGVARVSRSGASTQNVTVKASVAADLAFSVRSATIAYPVSAAES